MGSQKQSHRVRKLGKIIDMLQENHCDELDRMQRFNEELSEWHQKKIIGLIEKNTKLTKRLEHYESRPAWWKFAERKKWRAEHEND